MNFRAFMAYRISLSVVWKYYTLYLGKRVFGQKYWDRRIDKLHAKSALKIKKGLLSLNGLFIKVGQLISILSNILPPAFREPLESLQDQIPARPYAEIKRTLEQEFGRPLADVFARFDKTPLAAASIGQTHRATLEDGTEVVVKIQHKDIKSIAETDLKVVQNLVKVSQYFFDITGMDYLYSQVRLMIEEELDYHHEASVMQQIGRIITKYPGWIVPQVHTAYTTKKIITSTYYEGVKISDINQLDQWAIDREAMADNFLQTFGRMIFEDDIFHADPHPGNILVNKEGEIILLDFGAVTQLSDEIKSAFPKLIISFTKNDTPGLVKALTQMGFVGTGQETQALAEKLIVIGQNFLKDEVQIESFNLEGISIDPDSKIISKLFEAINIREIGKTFKIPKDWILLQRVLVLVLGISNQLHPHQNPIEVLEPYFKKMALGSTKDVTTYLWKALKSQAMTLISLPQDLQNTLALARKDGLKVQDESLAKIHLKMTYIFQQFIFVIIGIATLHFSPQLNEIWANLPVFLGGMSVFGFVYYFIKSR